MVLWRRASPDRSRTTVGSTSDDPDAVEEGSGQTKVSVHLADVTTLLTKHMKQHVDDASEADEEESMVESGFVDEQDNSLGDKLLPSVEVLSEASSGDSNNGNEYEFFLGQGGVGSDVVEETPSRSPSVEIVGEGHSEPRQIRQPRGQRIRSLVGVEHLTPSERDQIMVSLIHVTRTSSSLMRGQDSARRHRKEAMNTYMVKWGDVPQDARELLYDKVSAFPCRGFRSPHPTGGGRLPLPPPFRRTLAHRGLHKGNMGQSFQTLAGDQDSRQRRA